MPKFQCVQSLKVEDPNSWENSIFLTFDIDWAVDEIIEDCISLVANSGKAATLFVTHDFQHLNQLKNNDQFELGIHPNFNFLLDGDHQNGNNVNNVIEELFAIVPEAKSVRSHSLFQSSRILETFSKNGLTHDVNQFFPASCNMELKPWKLWNGLIRMPYFWGDDIDLYYHSREDIKPLASKPGLKIFDFHPIHVFLNTESIERYERTREFHKEPKKLIKYRYKKGYGTRDKLIDLLNMAS